MKYAELLKDQRWLDRRNEILKRDDWTCQRCGEEKDIVLNVHHKYYIPKTEPWDYPDEALITWCYHCHKEEEILKILQELNSLFMQRIIVYKDNIVMTSEKLKSKYNYLSNKIAHLREKLRKIEDG